MAVFTRENIKPVLDKILRDPELSHGIYSFYEEDPDNQDIFEELGEPSHIGEGEPGYEERFEEAIADSMSYLIGTDDCPDDEVLLNYLNSHLVSLSVMNFPNKEIFEFWYAWASEHVKDEFFLEDKEADLGVEIDYDNPPDFIDEVFPVKEYDNGLLLDSQHKYVLIGPSDNIDSYDDVIVEDASAGSYTTSTLMYLRDDCQICFVKEHSYKLELPQGDVLSVIRQFADLSYEPYTDAFLIDVVNGDVE